MSWGDTSILWASAKKPILTLAIKNIGGVSVHVHSIDIVAADVQANKMRVSFFPKDYVIFPNDELLVPVGEIETLSKLVDENYDSSLFTYTASTDPNATCKSYKIDAAQSFTNCSGNTKGFVVAINFTDIFGDRYRLNNLAYIHKEKWITSQNAE